MNSLNKNLKIAHRKINRIQIVFSELIKVFPIEGED